MFAGVTYNYFVINAIVTAELFLIFRGLWVIIPALFVHLAGVLISLREPRALDLWLARTRLCGRVRNHDLWRCNSYRP
jgi:type IV secretion system protein VirB3